MYDYSAKHLALISSEWLTFDDFFDLIKSLQPLAAYLILDFFQLSQPCGMHSLLLLRCITH